MTVGRCAFRQKGGSVHPILRGYQNSQPGPNFLGRLSSVMFLARCGAGPFLSQLNGRCGRSLLCFTVTGDGKESGLYHAISYYILGIRDISGHNGKAG